MLTKLIALITIFGTNPARTLGASNVQLASRTISLENRYEDSFVNGVFKDNILLTLNYMSGTVKTKNQIKWEEITKPYHYEFSLAPGETFAFHDQILPEYSKSVAKTTNAHFNYSDGFKSDGYLMGDGVCHLASIIYWSAKDAGLNAISPVNHNFAVIPEIPKEFGVSIYSTSAQQNLYITNSFNKPATFVFDYDGTNLSVSVSTAP
jgi:hypothetical protein